MIVHLINKFIAFIYNKTWKVKTQRILNSEFLSMFEKNGEGFYYANLKMNPDTKNFVAKAISFFTHNTGISHSVIMFYSDDLKERFTTDQWRVLSEKWKIYYGKKADINTSGVKILTLASADSNGLNYFDYSHYQSRLQTIRRVGKDCIDKKAEKKLLNFLMSSQVINSEYDYVGLFFRWLSSKIQDKKSYYCSEIVYDAFKKVNFIIADNDKPTPDDLENYNKHLIIYKNY